MTGGWAVVILLVFGGLLLYGAITTWLGVAQALGGARTHGHVQSVTCYYARGGPSCGGRFVSEDGRIDEHVRVQGSRSRSGPVAAVLVRKTDTAGVITIQSQDTAYVGAVTVSVVGGIVLGIFLTLLGLPLFALAAFAAVMMTLARRRQRATGWVAR